MLAGQGYKRTSNVFATRYVLEMIHRDYGLASLRNAVAAVQKHIDYYERLRSVRLLALRRIVSEFRAITGKQQKEASGLVGSGNELVEDLNDIYDRRKAEPTTRHALVDARLGQGRFRSEVLRSWAGCCSVTGSTTHAAIRASHIKAWRESSDAERLDPDNGLPLTASLDALFDAGLISFSGAGKLIASRKLSRTERDIFGLAGMSLRRRAVGKTVVYLAHHRAKHGFQSD